MFFKRVNGKCQFDLPRREMMLLALTHNLAVILATKKLFYRAGLIPFLHSEIGCDKFFWRSK